MFEVSHDRVVDEVKELISVPAGTSPTATRSSAPSRSRARRRASRACCSTGYSWMARRPGAIRSRPRRRLGAKRVRIHFGVDGTIGSELERGAFLYRRYIGYLLAYIVQHSLFGSAQIVLPGSAELVDRYMQIAAEYSAYERRRNNEFVPLMWN